MICQSASCPNNLSDLDVDCPTLVDQLTALTLPQFKRKDVPKKDDDPIGYLAVAMASGKILIYKISDVLFNNCDAEAVPVFEPITTTWLILNEISVDWAHFAGGDQIAAGNILIWELSNEEFTTEDGILPIEMSSESWNSPAVDVVLELPGESCNGGTCYLIPDRQNKGYFVVPLSNKHDICIWSISTCAINGVVSSCGVDGAVLMSINGRIAPNNATVDFTFSAQRKALQLTRIDEIGGNESGQRAGGARPAAKGAIKETINRTLNTLRWKWLSEKIAIDSDGVTHKGRGKLALDSSLR
ncbi:unnamed protein product, partial [Mesorhabditis belari]|uniref:Uncharacterized protein n=1 Tax=Mesorhabditis belari TaxID=2138241 RepID=A0AAF3FP12_9BILA